MVATATKRRQLENNLFSSCAGKVTATFVAVFLATATRGVATRRVCQRIRSGRTKTQTANRRRDRKENIQIAPKFSNLEPETP